MNDCILHKRVSLNSSPAPFMPSNRSSQPLAGVMTSSQHVYEVRPRKDRCGVDLVSDVLPFGRLWYGEPNAINNALRLREVLQPLTCGVIRVYNTGSNVMDTREPAS